MNFLTGIALFLFCFSAQYFSTGGFTFPDECESYSSCSSEEHGSDLNVLDHSQWINEISEQTTLIPYSKLFYKYIFEPLFNNDHQNEKPRTSIFGVFLNKATFAICLLIWSCILFIACGTVADTYISSLMIKITECLNLSDTFAGSTLLAFSNAASDVILGIVSVSIGEKDAIDVFLGDVIGASLFIILVVFGCVMVFSKSEENTNYIHIPVFNHLRDTIALTIGLIQLLLINHFGYISSKLSLIPLAVYCFYVLLLQWFERSSSLSMPASLTIKEEYMGPIYEEIVYSEDLKGSKLSLRNANQGEYQNYVFAGGNSVQPIPFTPPDIIKVQKSENGNGSDLEIPPIKLSFQNFPFSLDEKVQSIENGTVIGSDAYWDRIGSKSRSIKKTLLLLTPTHSPSPSLTNEDLSGRILTPASSIQGLEKEKERTGIQEDFEKGLCSSRNSKIPAKQVPPRERNYANTLEPPNPWNTQKSSRSPTSNPQRSSSQSKNQHCDNSSIPSSIYNGDASFSNKYLNQSSSSAASFSSRSSNIENNLSTGNNCRSSSQSQLLLVSDDYAVRLSRNLSMSEVVYQTESLHNSLLPPPAHEENVLKLQKRGRQRVRECRYRCDHEDVDQTSTLQLKIPQTLPNSTGFFRIFSFNTDLESLLDSFFEMCDFVRQLLMTPIMFVMYLTVPSPSLRRSVQILQPLFIVLAVGFEKKIYIKYRLLNLVALLVASIISLILFFIYTCILNTRSDEDEDCGNVNRVGSFPNIRFPEFQISPHYRKLLSNILMYCDMLCGIIMSIYWNGVLVNELVECIRVIGLTLGIKPAILGLTIVAMGNSIADLFANVAVSRAGHAHMGLAGCYGACVFLLLFGFGSSVFVRAFQIGFSKDIYLHFESQIITATYQLLYFLPFSALVVVLSKGRVHRIWGIVFILYFIICMVFVLKGVI
ncbi:Sodium/calcium exchanger protein [Cryptosporidium felis]|nr:Sodium/calcium exchanger protein [Cryptosporidium felis]